MLPDIYFEENYGKLHEHMYNGVSEVFLFESSDGKVHHSFLKRQIPQKLQGKTYFDLITPYGYGGPIIIELKGDKSKLVEEFAQAFRQYCIKENIVSEFIRYHPLLENYKDFSAVFNTSFMRQTVATRLCGKDPFEEEFSKGARKTTRQALRKGFHWEIIKSPKSLEEFKKIYANTMDRNQATDFYYFDDTYFQQLLELLGEHILVINVYEDEDCISSGLYFVYNNFMHAHLSGTHADYLKDNPAYILKKLSVDWGKEHGCDYIHYGGGVSNDPEDSLLTFKKRFTKDSIFEFHVAKNIYQPDKYNQLMHMTGTEDSSFFPCYRDPEKVKNE